MKTSFLILVLSVLAHFSAAAEIMVISDIDDTLKISNVLDYTDSAQNTVLVQNHFKGMSELFNAVEPRISTRFFYVSNAPQRAMGLLHDSFLNFNSFPEGLTYLRASIFDPSHKKRTIGGLILHYKPSRVILIGDNGEKDPLIYHAIRQQFPAIPIHTFIHQVYSSRSKTQTGLPLIAEQIGFATSVDLAGEFKKLNLLSENAYQQFIQQIVPSILNERNDLMSGNVAFPAWIDCRDMIFPVIDIGDALLTQYQTKARARCSVARWR